jgi:hypothetical protein
LCNSSPVPTCITCIWFNHDLHAVAMCAPARLTPIVMTMVDAMYLPAYRHIRIYYGVLCIVLCVLCIVCLTICVCVRPAACVLLAASIPQLPQSPQQDPLAKPSRMPHLHAHLPNALCDYPRTHICDPAASNMLLINISA